MPIKSIIAWLLAAALMLMPVSPMLHAPLAAQDADVDDDDDDDEDDDDFEDPDEQDPGDDDPGGDDDVGDDDIGGDDDVGDDDIGGDDVGEDDPGGEDDVGGDDLGDDDVGDDDVGEDDAGDDDAGDDDAGDDDAGDDDAGDDDAGDDDAGDDDAGDDDAGDDDLNDDRDDDDFGDADEDQSGQWDYANVEDEAVREELDERDRIDTDRDGFRYRRAEFVAMDLSPDDLAELRGTGFAVLASERLNSLDATVHLLRGPPRVSDEDSLDAIEAVADPDVFGLNHLFDSSAVRTTRKRGSSVPQRVACGCEIGLIDTGVATGLSYFKHVALVQRAFNGKEAQPRLHGTAVAHLMAGTQRSPERATKIYVADIFSGSRSTSGSSFALIKALDWLASQGVPVINISLSGPRNPAVASAIARMTRRGHVIVAAAGNDGPAAPPVFPGAYEGVVGVTAVDGANRIYRYANRGNYVDFSARGVAVTAIDAKGSVRDATGTSFAAPVVAARLAAQLRKPDIAASQQVIRSLEARARDLGPPGRDPIYGAGLIAEGD